MSKLTAKEVITLRERGLEIHVWGSGQTHIETSTVGLWWWANHKFFNTKRGVNTTVGTFKALAAWSPDMPHMKDLHVTSAPFEVHDSVGPKVMYRRPSMYLAGSPVQLLHDFPPTEKFTLSNVFHPGIGDITQGLLGLTNAHSISIELSDAEAKALNSGECILINPYGVAGRSNVKPFKVAV